MLWLAVAHMHASHVEICKLPVCTLWELPRTAVKPAMQYKLGTGRRQDATVQRCIDELKTIRGQLSSSHRLKQMFCV